MSKTDKQYISEIDKKLAEFDRTHPNTFSEQAEIDKHERVFHLRDCPELLKEKEEDLWE